MTLFVCVCVCLHLCVPVHAIKEQQGIIKLNQQQFVCLTPSPKAHINYVVYSLERGERKGVYEGEKICHGAAVGEPDATIAFLTSAQKLLVLSSLGQMKTSPQTPPICFNFEQSN